MQLNKNKKKGFTLIEILIVVAIIGILASIVLVGLGPAQRGGRDARRISDMRQIQTGLELYYHRCGNYPGDVPAAATGPCPSFTTTDFAGMSAVLTNVNSGLGITQIPNDPVKGRSYEYGPTVPGGTGYVLKTTLEGANSALDGDVDGLPNTIDCTDDPVPNYCVQL